MRARVYTGATRVHGCVGVYRCRIHACVGVAGGTGSSGAGAGRKATGAV